MSQWAQRPAMDRFRDIRATSDRNYIVNIFIYKNKKKKNISSRGSIYKKIN